MDAAERCRGQPIRAGPRAWFDGTIGVMTPHRWRLVWLVAVGLSQVALVAAVLELLALPTRTGMPSGFMSAFASRSRDVFFSGYPVPWTERHQEYAWTVREGEVWRGPEEFKGWNPVLPPTVVMAAVSLPPIASVLAACLARRARRRLAPVSFSRPARLWCVTWLASVLAVCVAWLEVQTAEFQALQTPWSAHEASRWVAESSVYRKLIGHAHEGRRWLEQRLPGGFLSSDWPSRTRLTLAAFLSGAAVGGLLFRPWRGVAPAPIVA